MPPQNELQAMFPAGSRMVHNPHGTAPGIDLEVPRPGRSSSRVICLPGVPAEMVEMWHDSVAAMLTTFAGPGNVIRRRRINCFGAGESHIESMLPDLIRRGRRPTVGINASKATIILRITAVGATEKECDAVMEPTVATIRQSLGTLVFGEEDDQLQHAVVRLLARQGKTLSTAECGSAGLVVQWLADVSGSEVVYRGGQVLVNTSEPVDTLAAACREQFGADFGLAVGQFAVKPGAPPQLETIEFALASPTGVRHKRISLGWHPALRRTLCAKHALNFLRLSLIGD